MDYVAAVADGVGYVEAVEKLTLNLRHAPSTRMILAPRTAAPCQPLVISGTRRLTWRYDARLLHLPGAEEILKIFEKCGPA